MDLERDSFDLSDANIQKLKDKYSKELEHDENNPIKICIKLIFDAATKRDKVEQSRISNELSQFLTKPDGLINLFLALVDFDTSSQKVTTHNQRFIAVANIITFLPNLCMPYEDYCLTIVRHLKQLLISENAQYSNLACIITKSLLDSPHSRGKNIAKIILSPIFESLNKPNKDERGTFWKPHETILIIDKLVENNLPKELFVELIPQLFYSLVALQESPSRLKMPLQRTLVTLLNHLKPGPACCQLDKTLFHSSIFYKTTAEDEDITIKVYDQCHEFEGYDVETIVRLMLLLLKLCNNDMLVLEFFFHFNETLWATTKIDHLRELNVALIEGLLKNATQEENQETNESNLDLMGIMASKPNKSYQLIVRTLLSHLNFMKSDQREFHSRLQLIEPSMNSCLEILEVLNATMSAFGSSEDIKVNWLPVLEDLKRLFSEHDIGADNRTFQSVCSLINQEAIDLKSKLQKVDGQEAKIEKEYASVLKDLNDKLEPVRVHALVKLKQLIQANEPSIVSKIPMIYPMIESSLSDPEPYVFLACIKLLAEMSLRNTDTILPKLCDLYLQSNLDLQSRLNVGEVLVQLSKQMNQTTPFYAQQVLGIFFVGCGDSEELIRVSSLTNIGEIGRNLGDSLSKYILDILSCISKVIGTDTIQVKCAAVDLLKTTLSGIDRLRVEGVQREMKSMYRMLKDLKSRTLDEGLCVQIDLALDEMDRLARALILGESGDGLAKNIKVLSLK